MALERLNSFRHGDKGYTLGSAEAFIAYAKTLLRDQGFTLTRLGEHEINELLWRDDLNGYDATFFTSLTRCGLAIGVRAPWRKGRRSDGDGIIEKAGLLAIYTV
jgi:hypothetical protein